MSKYGSRSRENKPYRFSFVGEDQEARPNRRAPSSRWFARPSISSFIIIVLLFILVGLMTAALIVLIVKKPQIEVVWDTMVTARSTLRSVNEGVDRLHELTKHYNLSAIEPPEELHRTIGIASHGFMDLMGLISEIRGSDLLTRYSKLAYSFDKILDDQGNQRSVKRILRTVADALGNTTRDDMRSIVSAADFEGLHACLETADKVVTKTRSLVDDLLRSEANQGLTAAVDKLVRLSKDPQFADMIRETPQLFHHLTEIIKSDDFKLVVSAGGQVLDRADGVLQETEQADLVARSDHVLVRIEHIAGQVEGIVQDLEDSGINIAVGHNGRLRTRALPTV